jgi:DNA polymerase-1
MSIWESMELVEMPAFEFICDMETNGILYDVNKNRQMSARMQVELDDLEERVFSALGQKVDLNSGTAMAKFLYEERGYPVLGRTKSGEPSVDGDTLKELSQQMGLEWLEWIGKRNDINSVHNTFVKTYVEDFVKRDGRIHPSYNLHGTSSFRITGDRPNLTQLPRPKHGYNVRSCYRVPDGKVFLALDFSSAEVKVLGALCKDPALLRAIAEGKDFHSFSASAMHGIPYDEYVHVLEEGDQAKAERREVPAEYRKYKQWRQEAKTLTFSILYGSSVKGIAETLGLTTRETENLMDMYFKTYPGIKTYIDDAHMMAKLNHYVVTPFGQRKQEFGTLDMFKRTAVYNAALRNAQNVRVQSTTSTLGLYVFTYLNEAIKRIGGKSLCTVYDSIELEIPYERAAEALEIAFYYMNDFPVEQFKWLDLPIGVEAEIGYHWGDLTVIPRGTTQGQIEHILSSATH